MLKNVGLGELQTGHNQTERSRLQAKKLEGKSYLSPLTLDMEL